MAVLTALAVFPLIFAGAGVTSQDAGMAYPDWPTSGGHLLNPPNWWHTVGTRWEHGHRLLGWAVGLLAIVLAVFSWKRGRAIRYVGLGTLLAITVQGVLGGLRVNLISTPLAMVHGVWGQICFCLAASAALMTSPYWTLERYIIQTPAATLLRRLCAVTASAVFVQLVLGAVLRHFGGGHSLAAHLAWAFVVTFLVGWTTVCVVAQHSRNALLAGLGRTLVVLMIAQLLLGAMAWLATIGGSQVWTSSFVRLMVPSAHVVAGALLLACSVALALSTNRFLRPFAAEFASAPALDAG